jgi:hypothetical protein
MATFDTGAAMIPAGEHILTLKECERILTTPFGADPDSADKEPQLIWRFVSNKADEDGTKYAFHTYTKFVYGDPRANLTKLLDLLVPGMNKEKAKSLDSDEMIGKKWKVHIRHEKNSKGDPKPVIALAEEYTGKPKEKPRPEPFSDDDVDE